MTDRLDPAEAERIAAAIDWQPTCLDGQERQTIVRQIGDMVMERLRAVSSVTPPPAPAVERVARWLFDNHAAAGVRSWGWDDILPGAQEGYRTEAADLLALVTEGDEARAEVERLRAVEQRAREADRRRSDETAVVSRGWHLAARYILTGETE